MSETIYIETSIFGYLTARSTDNLILAANIKVTQDWWDNHRASFILYASEVVLDEAEVRGYRDRRSKTKFITALNASRSDRRSYRACQRIFAAK